MSDTITIAPAIIPLDIEDAAGLEAVNPECGDRYEVVEVGPFAGNHYLRIRSTDLVVLAAELRRLADDIETGCFDERDRKADAERHDCYCSTRLEPDEPHCGARRCAHQYDLELAYEASL